jgi:hypothetical protein
MGTADGLVDGWWQASDGNWYPPHTHPDPGWRDHFARAARPFTAESTTMDMSPNGLPAVRATIEVREADA